MTPQQPIKNVEAVELSKDGAFAQIKFTDGSVTRFPPHQMQGMIGMLSQAVLQYEKKESSQKLIYTVARWELGTVDSVPDGMLLNLKMDNQYAMSFLFPKGTATDFHEGLSSFLGLDTPKPTDRSH